MRMVDLEGGYKLREDGVVFSKTGYQIAVGRNKKGYPHVTLYIKGRVVTYRLARLLAIHFIPNPNNLSDVDHINGNREDHSLDNLRWVSHGENIKHSYSLGNRSAVGSNNANSKLTDSQVHSICRRLSEGDSAASIYKSMGITQAMVLNIKNGKAWKHISRHYKW